MNEINLPDDGRPATVEEKLRAAVYQASMYYWPTKITYGHRTVYLIDEWTWKRLAAAAERAAELVPPAQMARPPMHSPDCGLVMGPHLTCTCGAFAREANSG